MRRRRRKWDLAEQQPLAVNSASTNRLPGIRVTKGLSQGKRFEIGRQTFNRRVDPAMDDIVLSAGVRQNLLALQSTAHLMSLTQNRLATGQKGNTAEDNPISFFTSQSLHSRAGDFNSLLDSIGQAQQVLSTANQGITSLSKLVQSGISTARQAQQSPIGYTTKSNVSTTIGGATALDLRGTTTYTSATAASTVLFSGAAGGTTAAVTGTTLGGSVGTFMGS